MRENDLDLGQQLIPNTSEVAAKVLDGEAILINLNSGVYYSTDQAGALLWELIEGGYTPAECAAELPHHFAVSLEQAQLDAASLCAQFLSEGLLLPAQSVRDRQTRERPPEIAPYVTPSLVIYRDMGELLALDPPVPELGLGPHAP